MVSRQLKYYRKHKKKILLKQKTKYYEKKITTKKKNKVKNSIKNLGVKKQKQRALILNFEW